VIVVDSSAVVDALTGVYGADDLRTRIRDEELAAPYLIDYEVGSALRGLVLGDHIGVARAADVLVDFADLDVRRWPAGDGLRRRAFDLRDNLSAYDAAYVVLAEALECPLVTRDERMARAVGHDAQIEVL
jgi:predicted nucleic acid-binding protein